jgi:TonB family protein
MKRPIAPALYAALRPGASLSFVPTWLLSVALHGAFVGIAGWFALQSLHAKASLTNETRPPQDGAIAVELPTFAEGTLLAERQPDLEGDPPVPAGGAPVPRVDTGRDGRGGDLTVDKPAIHLSDVDERLRMSTELLSRLDRDQVQRLRTSEERASREDRRSTTHPTELTFLASGAGDRPERRAPSPVDPSRGALAAKEASVQGGKFGTPDPVGAEGARSDMGGAVLGSAERSPGVGVRDGRPGEDHRAAAAVASARPDVTLGAVSVPALAHERPRDDVDSEQEVANAVRNLVHASSAGGLAGDAHGGSGGGGDPGAGGTTGAGSHPRPLGEGEGDWFDLNSSDNRLVPYFRRIHAKVDPLWADAFPKSAMLELKQGTVIIEFTIAPDGTAQVTWPPVRPSGIDEFDRNCANALRRASPFDPIPRELGKSQLRVRAPFVASNPIVK